MGNIRFSKHNSIYYFESNPFQEGSYQAVKYIDTKLDGFFSQNQLKNLDNIKDIMSKEASDLNCNVIINFKYGQKEAGLIKNLFVNDDILWFGKGELVRVTEQILNKILNQ